MDKPIITIGSTSSTEFSINLSWTTTGEVDGFTITRAIGSSSPITIVTLPVSSTTYADSFLSPATTYTYVVYAFNKCGEGSDSRSIQTGCPQIENIFGLTATVVSDNQINIIWDTFWTGYTFTIKRSLDGITYTTLANGITGTTYVDNTVTQGTCYYYEVIATACSTNSSGVVSSLVCATCTAPSAPNNLLATAISEQKITITWDAATGIVNTYIVQRFDNGVWSTITTVDASVLSFSDTDLVPSKQYCYKVIATNTCGSNEGISCDTTYLAPLCGSSEQTFNWSLFAIEPGLYPGEDLAPIEFSDTGSYIHYSPIGIIDVSDPMITGVQFGNSTDLDDILIMMKPNETVDITFPFGSSSNGRGHFSCVLPHDCILFLDTFGYYINGDTYDSRGHLTTRFTPQRDFVEAGTTNQHTVVAGRPPGRPGNTGQGHAADFAAAGFKVIEFGSGIDIATLQDKGFIVTDDVSGNRFFEFKFAHIVCGYGFVQIDNFTCLFTDSASSSSSCIAVATPALNPNDALCCLTINTLDIETIPGLSALHINLTESGGVISGGTVELTWPNVTGNNGYIIERSLTDSGGFVIVYITMQNINTFFDAGLDLTQQWCYRVTTRGCTPDLNSSPSSVVCTNQMIIS